jgi:hypothetical protein
MTVAMGPSASQRDWSSAATNRRTHPVCGGNQAEDMVSKAEKSIAVLEAFVLRARRVMEHSLVREQRPLIDDLIRGKFRYSIVKNVESGEVTQQELNQPLPAEELFESLAARMRPLIVSNEPIYYRRVFDAIETLVPADSLTELVEPMKWWRANWKSVTDRTAGNPPQAYVVMTQDGTVKDWELAYAWLYGDLVHADPLKQHTEVKVSIGIRYQAATGIIARIFDCVERTLAMVELLEEHALIELDESVHTVKVSVDPTDTFKIISAATALPGTPIPEDPTKLDPSLWTTIADDTELLGDDDQA